MNRKEIVDTFITANGMATELAARLAIAGLEQEEELTIKQADNFEKLADQIKNMCCETCVKSVKIRPSFRLCGLLKNANGIIPDKNLNCHELKTDPDPFQASWSGIKPYEIRINDREFLPGDLLILKETLYTGEEMRNGKKLIYTGRFLLRFVTEVRSGYGIKEGWVILGVKTTGTCEWEGCGGCFQWEGGVK